MGRLDLKSAIFVICGCFFAAIAARANQTELSGPPWRGPGVYKLESAGIQIEVTQSQRIFLTDEYLPGPLRRCYNEVAAVVLDSRTGLNLIGRTQSTKPVSEDNLEQKL